MSYEIFNFEGDSQRVSRLFVFLTENIVTFLQSISLDPQTLSLAITVHRNCHGRIYLSLNILPGYCVDTSNFKPEAV